MTSLTVWGYATPLSLDAAELRLKQLEQQGDLTVHDVVTVFWPDDKKRPRVRHRKGTRHDVVAGTAWGVLLGSLLGGPIGGAAAGAGAGALGHRARGPVMDERVVTGLREQIQPGTAAMFVLSSRADVDAVTEMIGRDPEARLLHHESDSPTALELLDELAERDT